MGISYGEIGNTIAIEKQGAQRSSGADCQVQDNKIKIGYFT